MQNEDVGSGNVVLDKSFDFAVRIVNAYKFLTGERKEFVLSKQLLRSGTSIGANVSEARAASPGRISTPKCALPSRKRTKLTTG